MVLLLWVGAACGEDIDTSELHAGECEVDADCPHQGQECVESSQHNYHYCVPFDCPDDSDCDSDSVCLHGSGNSGPFCFRINTPIDGVPCTEYYEGAIRCAPDQSGIVLCEDGVHRDVGACPADQQQCESLSGGVVVRCGEPYGDNLDHAVPGQDCYQEDRGACRPDREASLSCVDGTWEINEHCSTTCRRLSQDEPGVECHGFSSTCIGCAP